MKQRLRLETPEWRVLELQESPLSEDEQKWQRSKMKKGALVGQDREHVFAEHLTDDESGVVDHKLPNLATVCCLVDVHQI